MLVTLGASGFIWFVFKKTIFYSKAKLDFFSPLIFFPVFYSVFYGLGALELTKLENTIPLSQYVFYFVGLLSFFAGIFSIRIIWMKPFKRTPFKEKWDSSRLTHMMIILFSLFLICLLYILLKSKLPIFMGKNIEQLRTGLLPGVPPKIRARSI